MDSEENLNNLIDAILSGCSDKSMLDKLIKNVKEPKSFIEGTHDSEISAVGACILTGNMELLDTLISHGAPLNFNDPSTRKYSVQSPVEVAIQSKKPAMLKKLLEAGAQLSEYDIDSYIRRAMLYADKNLHCFTILMKHIYEDYEKYLIVDGCDQDFSPFHYALGYHEMYEGWKEYERDNQWEYSGKGMYDIVRWVDILINLGFHLNTAVYTSVGSFLDPDWEQLLCPLELAIMNKNCEAAILLISAGCAISSSEFYVYKAGITDILQYCIAYRTFELVKILVHAGAKVTEKHMKAIQKLLNGEDLSAFRYYDRNKKPSVELVEWLTEENSNPVSLKRLCRVMIRNHLKMKTEGCTILPYIEQLEIPEHTKEYLALKIL